MSLRGDFCMSRVTGGVVESEKMTLVTRHGGFGRKQKVSRVKKNREKIRENLRGEVGRADISSGGSED